MSTRDLLVFTAVVTTFILGITAVGWVYFVRWYKEEQKLSRRSSETEIAQAINRPSENKPD